ncbi:hypothetical protein Btru_057400 [Bulinus truncatus]|nr:hypothetical protein Btru_057400 [Bulinus truncatus]
MFLFTSRLNHINELGMIGMLHWPRNGICLQKRDGMAWSDSQFQSRLMYVVDQYGRFDWHGQQLKKFKSLQENMADTIWSEV